MFERVQLTQCEELRCGCCDTTLTERLAKNEYQKIISGIEAGVRSMGALVTEALVKEKFELFANRRAALVKAVKADYVDSKEIVRLCNLILDVRPGDFLAEFFKVANSSTYREVAEYISGIDEEENAAYMELVLDFITRSLRVEYINPTAALLERCSNIFAPEVKQKCYTRFEAEAGLVKAGIYETGISRDVFLAYSGKDMKVVKNLVDFLESDEIGLTCFAAYRNLQHGRDAVANYEKALREAMDNCSIFLFVSSVNSRSFSCDAFKVEMAYIRNSEMNKHPECRNYAQLPDKYKKLRVEYRLDNKPTPLADRNVREFFAGLTYVEDYAQLTERLAECMYRPFEDYEEVDSQNEVKRQADEIAKLKAELEAQKMADEIARLRAELEANAKATEEAKRKAEDEARLKAEAEAKMKSELEAKIKADYEAKFNAELEAKRRAEAEVKSRAEEEAKRQAEAEAKRRAEEEAKRKAEAEAKRKAEEEAKRKAEAEAKRKAEDEAKRKAEAETKRKAEEEAKRKATEYETKLQNAREQGFEIENGVLVKYNGSATEALIPDVVTSIGEKAFWENHNIQKVVIPNGVTTIGDGAFAGCWSLRRITIPNSVTTIGSSAFSVCVNLTSITIPDSVTTIGESAFSRCSNLTNITIPDSVKTIGDYAFCDCSSLTSITIPDSVITIGTSAFSNCYNLTSVTIPDSVTTIGAFVFGDCRNLISITIPNSVTEICNYAFWFCTSLREINIPSSVMRVGYHAFVGCKNLTVRIHKEAKVSRWDYDWNILRDGLISKKVKTVTYS